LSRSANLCSCAVPEIDICADYYGCENMENEIGIVFIVDF